jgi:hypothetical protein
MPPIDLDEEVRRLVERGAKVDEVRKRLEGIAGSANYRARKFATGPRGSRYLRKEERALEARAKRILIQELPALSNLHAGVRPRFL